MRQGQTSVLLAAESLIAKNSGIGRVARLMAKVMSDLCKDNSFSLRGVSLSDPKDAVLDWSWARPCGGDRLRYVLGVQSKGIMAREIFYDSLSMARAHFMGPARWRASLTWMHGVEVWENARPEHLRAARRATVLVTNSEYTRRRASALHPGLEDAQVCWLGTETDELPPVRTLTNGSPPTALILARIDEDSCKGHKELIQVWPTVIERVPDARLLIAGSDSEPKGVRQLVEMSPASPSIELLGFVPEAELPELWARTSVLAMPSRSEGFGMAYIEAMHYGIPVIASRQDAGQEINVHGETGFNVDLDRPRELVEALVALLGNRRRALDLGVVARRRWQKHFTYSDFQARFAACLR